MPERPVARLRVRLTPRSGRDEVTGEQDGVVLVRLKAPPVEGAANEALVAFLAKRLGLPRSGIAIVPGHRSRLKTLEIEGLSAEQALSLLGLRHAGPPRSTGSTEGG